MSPEEKESWSEHPDGGDVVEIVGGVVLVTCVGGWVVTWPPEVIVDVFIVVVTVPLGDTVGLVNADDETSKTRIITNSLRENILNILEKTNLSFESSCL